LDSVIIGHYYYGKLLWKMQNELEKREDKQLERQQNGEPVLIDSWVDAFIMGDVYILGFGFDLSEMDLWWLLNRKKRENANHGKTIFYDYEDKENVVRHALLRAYGAEVRTLGASKRPDDFKAFYNRTIEDIQMNVNTAEGLGGTKQ
jgi:hypothetical protein